MKYNLNISQAAAIDVGLEGKVDIIDLAIFDVFRGLFSTNKINKLTYNGYTYVEIRWRLVVKESPFIGITTRSPIHKRFKKLCDVGLMEAHPDNQKTNSSWYKMGYVGDKFQDCSRKNNVSSNKHTEVSNVAPESSTEHTPCVSKNTPPVSQKTHNNSTNNNSTNNNSKSKSKRKRFEPPTLDEVKEYFNKKGYSSKYAEKFWYFYDGKGWMVGKNKMKRWTSAAGNWFANAESEVYRTAQAESTTNDMSQLLTDSIPARDKKSYINKVAIAIQRALQHPEARRKLDPTHATRYTSGVISKDKLIHEFGQHYPEYLAKLLEKNNPKILNTLNIKFT